MNILELQAYEFKRAADGLKILRAMPRIRYSDKCEDLESHMRKLVPQIYKESKIGGLKSLERQIRMGSDKDTMRGNAFIKAMNEFLANDPPNPPYEVIPPIPPIE